MFARLSDQQLLALLRKYRERFELTAASGKSPEGSDITQAMNADVVFREAVRRGLVDKAGKVKP